MGRAKAKVWHKQHNRYGPEPIRLTQVIYRGMAQAAQAALLVKFVSTGVYTTVENNGKQTTQTPYAPSKP